MKNLKYIIVLLSVVLIFACTKESSLITNDLNSSEEYFNIYYNANNSEDVIDTFIFEKFCIAHHQNTFQIHYGKSNHGGVLQLKENSIIMGENSIQSFSFYCNQGYTCGTSLNNLPFKVILITNDQQNNIITGTFEGKIFEVSNSGFQTLEDARNILGNFRIKVDNVCCP